MQLIVFASSKHFFMRYEFTNVYYSCHSITGGPKLNTTPTKKNGNDSGKG
jgi:hypothetical protein